MGVELFDPRGKNSGIVHGKQYFNCADQHGLFVRPTQLQVRELVCPGERERERETKNLG